MNKSIISCIAAFMVAFAMFSETARAESIVTLPEPYVVSITEYEYVTEYDDVVQLALEQNQERVVSEDLSVILYAVDTDVEPMRVLQKIEEKQYSDGSIVSSYVYSEVLPEVSSYSVSNSRESVGYVFTMHFDMSYSSTGQQLFCISHVTLMTNADLGWVTGSEIYCNYAPGKETSSYFSASTTQTTQTFTLYVYSTEYCFSNANIYGALIDKSGIFAQATVYINGTYNFTIDFLLPTYIDV